MIQFEHIDYLYLLLLIPLLIILFILMMNWKKSALKRFGDLHVIRQLVPNEANGRPVLKFVIILFAIAFIIVGITNPQTGSKLEKIQRRGIDIMIALDVSNSMMAQDIKPSRLSRAKQAISNLIDRLDGDRVGIIVFAGNAYTQLPITTDYAAAKMFLANISTESVPSQGTAIADALNLAVGAFNPEDDQNKAIIIITDGETHEGDAVQAAEAAKELGIKIFTIGMGLPEGAPIPVFNKQGNQIGFKKDNEGETVITKLNDLMLSQIASAGGGSYVNATNSNAGLKTVVDEINEMEKKEIESRIFADYEDQFQYFIAIGILLLLIEYLIFERKGKLAMRINLFDVKQRNTNA